MIKMTEMDRRQFLLATAAAGALTALGGLAAQAQASKVLRIRSYSDLQVLDPAYRLAAPEDDIFRSVLPALITYKSGGDKWEWTLDAAESIEQIDDTHIRFKLRPGWTWSGGFGELTAEDVKFSFERIADPANKSPYQSDWAALDHVEITDTHSGVIVLKEYFAPLWSTTLPTGSGRIVSKKAVEALPDKKFTTTIPAGCGPYLLKEWQPKQRTTLARNPDYKGPSPYFDEIHILPIEDEKAAEVAFDARELDFTQIGLGTLAGHKGQAPAGTALVNKPSLAFIWLGMNVENEILKNEKVRKAIQRAVDVDSVLDAAYYGEAARSTGIVAPGLIGHRDANLSKFDPEASRALLAEAGASDLHLTVHLQNKTDYLAMAQVLQANLADVGITVELVPLDSGSFWTLGDQSAGDSWKSIQLIISRFSMNPDPAWATEWFTPEQIGVWNWERWNSAEFGQLDKDGVKERDVAKRDTLYKHMQDLMEDSGAYLFLTHGAAAFIHRSQLRPGLWPDGKPAFHEFTEA